jgi:hypothetical protein
VALGLEDIMGVSVGDTVEVSVGLKVEVGLPLGLAVGVKVGVGLAVNVPPDKSARFITMVWGLTRYQGPPCRVISIVSFPSSRPSGKGSRLTAVKVAPAGITTEPPNAW